MAADKRMMIYDSRTANYALKFCTVTLPFWIVVSTGALGAAAAGIPAKVFEVPSPLLAFMDIAFIASILFGGGAFFTGILKENTIEISADGLLLPTFKKLDRFLDWRNISKVVLAGDELDNLDSLHLQIFLKKGPPISLALGALNSSDVEYILVSLNSFVGASSLDPRLELLKENLWNSVEINAISYTKMWDEELSRRFSASAFIPLNPGRKLKDGTLKVIRQLALGGWSAIYLVQDANTNLRIVKESVIVGNASKEVNAKAQELFKREAQLLMRISHPNIVAVHGHFVEEERHYLLLDYIRGQNLRQTVNLEGPMHPLDVIDYGKQICDMLEYLHSQTPIILHRDLSPDNLVLASNRRLVLIDFGAANEMIGAATGTLVGKQCYISPEQFRGRATTASDIYALGATLHFMLTGADPEPLSSSCGSPDHGMIELNKLIERLTAQEPDERPASAAEVKGHLISMLQNIPIVSSKTG